MLSEPSLVARDDRANPQGESLFPQQGVTAIGGAVRPNLARLGKVADVFGRVARPRNIFFAGLEWGANGVDGLDPVGPALDDVECDASHSRHGPHGHDDIRRISDFDSDAGHGGTDRTHEKRNHIQGAAAHRAGEQPRQRCSHLCRVAPVVGGAGVALGFGTDERAAFHAGHVVGVAAREERVRAEFSVERDERRRGDQFVDQVLTFTQRPVAPVNLVGGGEPRNLVNPLPQVVAGGWRNETRSGR